MTIDIIGKIYPIKKYQCLNTRYSIAIKPNPKLTQIPLHSNGEESPADKINSSLLNVMERRDRQDISREVFA